MGKLLGRYLRHAFMFISSHIRMGCQMQVLVLKLHSMCLVLQLVRKRMVLVCILVL